MADHVEGAIRDLAICERLAWRAYLACSPSIEDLETLTATLAVAAELARTPAERTLVLTARRAMLKGRPAAAELLRLVLELHDRQRQRTPQHVYTAALRRVAEARKAAREIA